MWISALSYLFKGKKKEKRKGKREETASQWVLSLKWSKNTVVLTNYEKAVRIRKGKNVMAVLLSIFDLFLQSI